MRFIFSLILFYIFFMQRFIFRDIRRHPDSRYYEPQIKKCVTEQEKQYFEKARAEAYTSIANSNKTKRIIEGIFDSELGFPICYILVTARFVKAGYKSDCDTCSVKRNCRKAGKHYGSHTTRMVDFGREGEVIVEGYEIYALTDYLSDELVKRYGKTQIIDKSDSTHYELLVVVDANLS